MSNIKMISFVGVVLVAILITISVNRETKYPTGRDTIKSFGDGTYQLQRTSQNVNILISLEPPQQVLVSNVKKFKEVNRKVYIIGDGKFFILKYREKGILQKDTLDGLPKEDKAIFEKMI